MSGEGKTALVEGSATAPWQVTAWVALHDVSL
jgi:hypothetical protein